MNTSSKKQTGNLGENLAEKFFKKHNYKILSKNFYSRWGEIDIVAQDKKTKELVFVEVKTRSSNKFGWPEAAVTDKKRKRLAKTGQKYLLEKKIDAKTNYRFDILAVELNYQTRRAKITQFKYV